MKKILSLCRVHPVSSRPCVELTVSSWLVSDAIIVNLLLFGPFLLQYNVCSSFRQFGNVGKSFSLKNDFSVFSVFNLLTLTILSHFWHLLVIQSCTLLVSLVKVAVLVSFFDHSWNSNFQLAIRKFKLSTGNKETIFLNIYRPPSSKMSTFLDEFQNLLEIFVPSPSELIISGDFNIHADSDLSTPNKFSGILDNLHLTQHINFPFHDDGHTLDLLITRSSSTVVTHLSHHESYQSDHKSFTFKYIYISSSSSSF